MCEIVTILGRPQGKQRVRVVKCNGRIHSYTPKETINYEQEIKTTYKALNNPNFGSKPVSLYILATYPIPKNFPKKKKEMCLEEEIYPCVKPDMDNVVKIVSDALNGVAYCDDKQVVQVLARKVYGLEAKLEILVEELSDGRCFNL